MANKPPIDFQRNLRHGAQPSMADFARAVAEGVAGARDRFNNPIQRGHMVTYRADVDPVYEVIDVAPILDPRQPGMVKVTLVTTIPLRVIVNQPTPVLLVIGTVPQVAAPQPHAAPLPDAPPAEAALPPIGLVFTDANEIEDALRDSVPAVGDQSGVAHTPHDEDEGPPDGEDA